MLNQYNMHPGKKLREKILKQKDLNLIKVFDTVEHEAHKDVCLVEGNSGKKMVLRQVKFAVARGYFPMVMMGSFLRFR